MQKLLSIPFYRRLLLLAVLLHLCAAWFSEGFYNDNEHSNGLYISLKTGDVSMEDFASTLEYGEIIRSAFQPFIGYALWQIVPDNANTPFVVAFLMRLLSAILAFVAALAFFLAYQNDIKNEAVRRWVLAAMLLCWVMLFYHVRFSAGGWMASFLLLGFACLRWRQFLAAGLLFGLAVAIRYQTGFILLPLGVWILWIMRPSVRNIALLIAGGCVGLVMDFFVNWWFYGEPILIWVNYFLIVVTGDTIVGEGGNGALSYWYRSGELMPPIGYFLPLLLVVFWWKFPRHALTWATVLYIAILLYANAKEPRFLYPILAFMPYIIALVWEAVIQQREKLRRVFLWVLKISVVINAPLVLFAAFYPAAAEVKLLRECVLPKMRKDGLTAYFLHKDILLRFYYRDMPVEFVADESDLAEKIKAGEAVLYVSRKPRDKQLQEIGLEYERVCSGLPEWALRLNFNNWTARASSYPVYRVVKS